MASVPQLTTSLRNLLQSIHNTIAGKLDAAGTAANASKLDGSTKIQIQQEVVSSNLGHVSGRIYKNTEGPGFEALYLDHDGTFLTLGNAGIM